jgi:hypothetical protein
MSCYLTLRLISDKALWPTMLLSAVLADHPVLSLQGCVADVSLASSRYQVIGKVSLRA